MYRFFPTGYQPLYPQQQNYQSNNLTWVTGEAGAKAYMVAANQSIALWDSEEPVIYIKSADASGIPTIRTLDYTVRDAQGAGQIFDTGEFATKEDISLIKDEIEALKENITTKKTKVSER